MIGPLTFKNEEGALLVFAYHDVMGGPGSERDDGLVCAERIQFLASNRWVRWYGHLT